MFVSSGSVDLDNISFVVVLYFFGDKYLAEVDVVNVSGNTSKV